jgi:hypothetical protein
MTSTGPYAGSHTITAPTRSPDTSERPSTAPTAGQGCTNLTQLRSRPSAATQAACLTTCRYEIHVSNDFDDPVAPAWHFRTALSGRLSGGISREAGAVSQDGIFGARAPRSATPTLDPPTAPKDAGACQEDGANQQCQNSRCQNATLVWLSLDEKAAN